MHRRTQCNYLKTNVHVWWINMTQLVTSESSWNSKSSVNHIKIPKSYFPRRLYPCYSWVCKPRTFFFFVIFFFPPSLFYKTEERRNTGSYGRQIQRTWQKQEEFCIFSPVTALCRGLFFISLQQTIKSYWTKCSAFLSESSGITKAVLQRWQTVFWYLAEPHIPVYLIYSRNPVLNTLLHLHSAYQGHSTWLEKNALHRVTTPPSIPLLLQKRFETHTV